MSEWNTTIEQAPTQRTGSHRLPGACAAASAHLRDLVAETTRLRAPGFDGYSIFGLPWLGEGRSSRFLQRRIFSGPARGRPSAASAGRISTIKLGIKSVLLFGTPSPGAKDASGTSAHDADGAVPRAVRAHSRERSSAATPLSRRMGILRAYTDHGHRGILVDGEADNDGSLAPLAAMWRSRTRKGCRSLLRRHG